MTSKPTGLANGPGWRAHPQYVILLEPLSARARGYVDGCLVVDSRNATICLEQGHGSVYYFPRCDVRMDLMERTDRASYCQYKGFARYWSLVLSDQRVEDIAWAYDEPFEEVAGLRGLVGLYWHLVDEWYEDDVRVSAPRDIEGRIGARNSFRSLYPELAREWHPRRNPNVWPYEVAPFSDVIVWWQDQSGNEWQETVRSRMLSRPAST